MTSLSQRIFDYYQTRKTKKQKNQFIDLLKQHFPDTVIQEGGFPRCRNLIVGDIENAKVILTAHYDTCALLTFPNFIAPKNPVLSILYSILLVIPILIAVVVARLLLNCFTDNYLIHYWSALCIYALFLLLLLCGPANKNTANDNTSGVIALCELLQTLTPQLQQKVAFVFFDQEESGLIGSSYFRSKYKRTLEDKLLINLDCISDGDNILITASKSARSNYGDMIKDAFSPTETKSIIFTKAEKTYYPSDQIGFKNAVAIAALKKKPVIGYYMDKIHATKDKVFDKENIKLICSCIHKLIKLV